MTVRGDFLVIGSGIAGLRAALSLADYGDVLVLTKSNPHESNTEYAQGGIAAAVGSDDSPELHARDTIAAGDGLCIPAAVDIVTRDGPRYVEELLAWGAAFDRDQDGRPALGREAAHSVRRVLHSSDATGREIARVLWQRVAANPRVRVLDDAQATGLVVDDQGCTGATFLGASGSLEVVQASRTLVATGGAGQVFRETTNPSVATGDGIAMSFDAGARVCDLEFVQFHPTVMSVPGAPRFLLSEAMRGEGGAILNEAGERFVHRYEPAGDLASRDLVARAIVREMERTAAPVYLSMTGLDAGYVRRRFPTIAAACQRAGLDLTSDRIPISPAAHYVMGGVETDLDGRTSVARLFAAGEAACTGLHGANRLASNSLLEGLVFGARAARAMAEPVRAAALAASQVEAPRPAATGTVPRQEELRDLMWRSAGLLRTPEGLEAGVATLSRWRRGVEQASGANQATGTDREFRRIASLVTVGWLVAHAALRRQESRGGHFRADFPQRDDLHWQHHIADRAVTSA